MLRSALVGLGAAALGLVLAIRIFDGSVNALVQSWYTPILEGSAVVLVVLGATVAIRAMRGPGRPMERPRVRSLVNIGLIAAPLILALVFKPEPLAGKSLDSSDGSQRQFSRTAGGTDPTQRNVYGWAYVFATDPPSSLVGQPVDVTGFVHHGKDDQGDRFSVARFVVACCVADAAGYTLPVQWKSAAELKDDGWVRIKGKVALGGFGQPIIQADSVEAVAAPDSPYIYP